MLNYHYRITIHCYEYNNNMKVYKQNAGCIRYGYFQDDHAAIESARELWKRYDEMKEIKVNNSSNEMVLHYNNFKDYGL